MHAFRHLGFYYFKRRQDVFPSWEESEPDWPIRPRYEFFLFVAGQVVKAYEVLKILTPMSKRERTTVAVVESAYLARFSFGEVTDVVCNTVKTKSDVSLLLGGELSPLLAKVT